MFASSPPPFFASQSYWSTSMPLARRKAVSPSGRAYGPENSTSTLGGSGVVTPRIARAASSSVRLMAAEYAAARRAHPVLPVRLRCAERLTLVLNRVGFTERVTVGRWLGWEREPREAHLAAATHLARASGRLRRGVVRLLSTWPAREERLLEIHV